MTLLLQIFRPPSCITSLPAQWPAESISCLMGSQQAMLMGVTARLHKSRAEQQRNTSPRPDRILRTGQQSLMDSHTHLSLGGRNVPVQYHSHPVQGLKKIQSRSKNGKNYFINVTINVQLHVIMRVLLDVGKLKQNHTSLELQKFSA